MACLQTFLAASTDWQDKCKNEVDGIVRKYRTSPEQPIAEILASLSLSAWEFDFCVVYSCLSEILCPTPNAVLFRKNESACDIPIGESGLVVPKGSYASYIVDDKQMSLGLCHITTPFKLARSFDRNVVHDIDTYPSSICKL